MLLIKILWLEYIPASKPSHSHDIKSSAPPYVQSNTKQRSFHVRPHMWTWNLHWDVIFQWNSFFWINVLYKQLLVSLLYYHLWVTKIKMHAKTDRIFSHEPNEQSVMLLLKHQIKQKGSDSSNEMCTSGKGWTIHLTCMGRESNTGKKPDSPSMSY